MKLARHARNNMRLYNISQSDVRAVIDSPDVTEKEGNKIVAIKSFSNRFSGYPLKVVYEIIDEEIAVITAYPLKKKEWR